MAPVTLGQARGALSEAYETLAELAVADMRGDPSECIPHKPEYWVGRLQGDLFAVAEMFQALLASAEKNAKQ